jgi:hypothetical protein
MATEKTKTTNTVKMEAVRIPYDQLNPTIHTFTVIYNGIRYDIQRGVVVEVPSFVADILRNSKAI